MGKYNGLKKMLPKFELEPDFRAKVDEAKKAFIGCDAPEMARAFAITRREKQGLEAQIKMQNVELEALSQLLVENLEDSEVQKIQLATGETVYLQDEPYATVEDRSKVMAWMRSRKLTAMFTVQWQSFNAMVKDMLVQGKPIPPGTKVFMKTSARLRGGNSQSEEN